MKVAQINMFPYGSTGNIMLNIARAARQHGHTARTYSTVPFDRYEKSPEKKLEDHYCWGSPFENMVHYYLGSTFGGNGLHSKHGTKKLLEDIERFSPDIIHLHNLHKFCINLPMLFDYLKRSGADVIWTLHDCWAFTGHCAQFSAAKCDRWKFGCGDCPQLKAYPKTYGVDHTQRNYRQKQACFTGLENLTIIVPSKWLAGVVKQSFLKEYPVEVLHNQIDKSLFKPTPSGFRKQYGLDGKTVVLGAASVWDKEKGLLDFCRLREKLDSQFAIVLVGVTEKQKSRLLPGILALPRTASPGELAEIYSAADVFVNPTHQDTYPTVNLEARACGTPVITYDVGGSPESAGGKYIVKENDIDGLAEQIYKLTEREAVELSV